MLPDPEQEAIAIANLAIIAFNEGDYAEARESMGMSEHQLRSSRDQTTLALLLCCRGFLDVLDQHFDEAESALNEVDRLITLLKTHTSQELAQARDRLHSALQKSPPGHRR